MTKKADWVWHESPMKERPSLTFLLVDNTLNVSAVAKYDC